jgi:hypothetical protein
MRRPSSARHPLRNLPSAARAACLDTRAGSGSAPDACARSAQRRAVAPTAAAERSGAGMGVAAAASNDRARLWDWRDETCIFFIGLHAAAELATGEEPALAIVKELGLVLGVAWCYDFT